MEFYPEENREIINRAVSYIYIYMEEEPVIMFELEDEEKEG